VTGIMTVIATVRTERVFPGKNITRTGTGTMISQQTLVYERISV